MKSQSGDELLDDTDLRILRLLQRDGDFTNRALAEQLGLAESTCAHRVRVLRARGVIRGSQVRVNEAALGYPIQALIRVRLGSHSASRVRNLFDALCAIPSALRVFHVAGVDDFLVHVAVRDPEALRDVVLEHITVHPVVRATETQLLFEVRDGQGPLI
ncbi:Lrp/AsnC family transcriptional regulator [Microbacterium kunmingense]|uniref:Lrp/AsnC family transcriptional regulator n=1 Tax=Microbacterium kunmingense TaxID=2915939 RepID=UPI0020059BA8|nr:Lrp/AsnC family transcriptional regulator [Microbacterium kunmingense]